MEDHVNWTQEMGAWVLINAVWYYVLDRRKSAGFANTLLHLRGLNELRFASLTQNHWMRRSLT